MYCKCGCGQSTPIARRTRLSRGHIKGQPIPYLFRHEQKSRTTKQLEYIGPVVLCACGCDLPTPIAKKTDNRDGIKKGQPTHYIHGHATGYTHEPDVLVQIKKDTETRRRYKAEQRQRVKDFVGKYLEEHPCVDCGFKDTRALDFDHRDPKEKYKTISQIIHGALGIKVLEREILKCDVRCANCHRVRHHKESH